MKVYNNIDDLKEALKRKNGSNKLEYKDESNNLKDKHANSEYENIESLNYKKKLMQTKSNIQGNAKNNTSDNQGYFEKLENYDRLKTKVLKYVVYKKRTENEIRQKFAKEIDENTLDEIISELTENGYINDDDYIKRAVNEFIALRNLSLWEIKYKLITKGIKSDKIDEYFEKNEDELNDYEKRYAKKIAIKKENFDKIEIKKYLVKKGYREDSIREALED